MAAKSGIFTLCSGRSTIFTFATGVTFTTFLAFTATSGTVMSTGLINVKGAISAITNALSITSLIKY